MLNSRFFMGLGLAIALLAANKPIAAGQEDQTVVAEVGGHKITAEELHQKEASNLLQAQYKYYLAERQALDQLVDKELLEIQAAKEGVTVDELLKRHVTVEVKEPTEDQLKFYYEGLNTEEPYEAVRTNILDTVKQLREKKGRTAYVNTLRSDLGVVIELNQPSAKVDVTNAERIGSPSAPVQIVEFADYQCPYCQKVHPALAKLQEQLGDKVSVVFKDFPLPMHPYSYMAARWSNAAAKIGKFEVVDGALFDNQAVWSADGNIEKFVAAAVGPADFKRIKKLMEGCDVNPNLGVKPAAFNNSGQADHGCLLDTYIEQDKQLAKQIPVTQTPTSVITYKGQRYPAMPGFVTWPILKQFFDSLMKQ